MRKIRLSGEHRQKKKEAKSKAERERIGKWEPEKNGERSNPATDSKQKQAYYTETLEQME